MKYELSNLLRARKQKKKRKQDTASTCIYKDRERDRKSQTDRETDSQAGRQTGGQIDRQADRESQVQVNLLFVYRPVTRYKGVVNS